MARLHAAAPKPADAVADAMARDFEHLLGALGRAATTATAGEAFLLVSGIQLPVINGVFLLRASARESDVDALLDIVSARNLPHCVQLRPGSAPGLLDLARRRGMTEIDPEPLMILGAGEAEASRAAALPGLSIRALEPAEADLHALVAADGFEAPVDIFRALIPAAVLELPGVRVYVGTAGEEVVTTAVGITRGDHVGVFDVATPARHRGRGYGAAVTARAVLDGFDSGASFAHLQSSTAGLHVYQRLGFRTLESWSIWITA